jgi:endonuclease/exonuclease/phosphatase family metal-dependent hydrolase
LRIVAANLSSGNLQSYDPGHGKRILQALKPDVVLIQEFNYGSNTPADLQSFVDATFGPGFSYAREGGQIPNGVISRYPILASGEWDDPEVSNRDFVWARIDLPGPADLWAISVHFLTGQSGPRTKEANALIAYVQAQIPDGQLMVLGGDFNTGTRNEGCVNVLSAEFVTDGPYPVDQDDNGNTNAYRNSPYDWVIGSPELHSLAVPTWIEAQTFPNGLVFDSRVYTPLSDVPPVLEEDSAATQMQHMAVVRDFVVP